MVLDIDEQFEENRKKAKEIFKKALILKRDTSIPLWKKQGKINHIIDSMLIYGYHTKYEWVETLENGGKVEGFKHLYLLHKFTRLLSIESEHGFVHWEKIRGVLQELEIGKKCCQDGSYPLSNGAKGEHFKCGGTGWLVNINEKTYELTKKKLKQAVVL